MNRSTTAANVTWPFIYLETIECSKAVDAIHDYVHKVDMKEADKAVNKSIHVIV